MDPSNNTEYDEMLEEHELSQDQAGRVVDTFLAHSPSGAMQQSDFSLFLLEGFAYSLFSHEAFADSCTHVRGWLEDGRLTAGIDLENQVIRRTFEYFDVEATASLRLRHVLDGIEKIAVGTFGTVARYLFFITDATNSKSIGRSDLEGYFGDFSKMYLRLAINVASLERQYLCSVGVDLSLVDAHVADLQSQLNNLHQTVAAETSEVLRDMSPEGERVSYSDWLGGREYLPRIYRTILALCDGLVYYDDRGIRPTFDKASTDLMDPSEVTLTSDEAQRIVDMFLAHTASSKMQLSEFKNFLLEGFAHAFFSQETFEYSSAHVREWISDGSLALGLDLTSPLFERTFQFFDTQAAGELDLRTVGSGIARMTSGSLEDFARYLFFLTDLGDNNTLSEGEILAFFRHFIRFSCQLSMNLLELERSQLIHHHHVDRKLIEQLSHQHKHTLSQVHRVAAESTEQALSSVLQGEAAQRISFHKWLNLRGALPKLYNRMRTVCVAMLRRDAPAGVRPSFAAMEAKQASSKPTLTPIKIPTRQDVAGIAQSPSSPVRPPPSLHTKLQAASMDARVSPLPKSPIQQQFLTELREQKQQDAFSTPPRQRPPEVRTSDLSAGGVKPLLSPMQRSVLRGMDEDLQFEHVTGLSVREVALTPKVMKNLSAIERLESDLAKSPVRFKPSSTTVRRDITRETRQLPSASATAGNPALCAVSDTLSAANTDEVATLQLRLNLELDFANEVVAGSVEIEMVKQSPTCSQVWLDIHSLVIQQVALMDEHDGSSLLEFNVVPVDQPFGASVLQVQLPEDHASDNFCLRVNYLSANSNCLVWVQQDVSEEESPCVFSCGAPCSTRGLFPCQDTPAVKVPYTASVTVPQGATALMSANLKSTNKQVVLGMPSCTFNFEMLTPVASHDITLLAGVLDSEFIGTRSRVWAAPGQIAAAVEAFDGKVDEIIESLSMHYVDHSWGVFDIAVAPRCFPKMATGSPCLTIVSPTLEMAGGHGTEGFLDAVSSLWFGSLVTAATWPDHWLSSALARHAARRVLKDMFGAAASEMATHVARSSLQRTVSAEGVQLVRQQIEGVPGMREEVTAEKGYLLLQLMQQRAGCTDFEMDNVLASFCDDFKFQSVTTNDLFAFLFEKFPLLTQPELNFNFREWLIGEGLPEVPEEQDWVLAVRSLAHTWSGQGDLGELAEAAMQAPAPVAAWSRWHKLAFLDALLDLDELPRGAAAAIDKAYGFSESTDVDLLTRWFQIEVKSGGQPSSAMQELLQGTGVSTVHMAMAAAVPLEHEMWRKAQFVHREVKAALAR